MKNNNKLLIITIVCLSHMGGYTAGKKASINWKDVPFASGYVFEVKNKYNRVVLRKEVLKSECSFYIRPGDYRGRISVLNKFKKVSVKSGWFKLTIKKRLPPWFNSLSKTRFSPNDKEFVSILNGNRFEKGMSVYLKRGRKKIPVTSIRYISKVLASIYINPNSFKHGYYDLVLQNPGGLRTFKKDAVFINRKVVVNTFFKPVFKNATPSVFFPMQGNVKISVKGNNFQEGCEVYLQSGAKKIKGVNLEYHSDNLISFSVNTIVLGKGYWNMIIMNPGNSREIVPRAIRITGAITLNSSDGSHYDKVLLQWTKGLGAAKYLIFRSKSSKSNFKKIDETSSSNYKDTTTRPGEKFYYKIRPVSESGKPGPFSAVDRGHRKMQIEDVNYKTYIKKINVTWKKLEGVNEYFIYRSLSRKNNYERIGSVSDNSYDDISAVTDKEYFYQVRSKTKKGNMIDSEPAAISTTRTKTGLYLRSLLPGWGQLYLHKNIKAGIYFGSFALSLGFLSYAIINESKKEDTYNNLEYGLPQSKYDEAFNQFETAKSMVYGAVIFVGLVYVINWVDILFLNNDVLPPWQKSSADKNNRKVTYNFGVEPIQNNQSNMMYNYQNTSLQYSFSATYSY